MSINEIAAGAIDGLSDYNDEIAGLKNGARRQADSKVKAAKSALKAGLGKAKDGSREALSRAREASADALDELDGLMRERPVVTLAVGVAIGAAVGLLLGRMLGRDD